MFATFSQDHQDGGALLVGEDEAVPAGGGPPEAAAPAPVAATEEGGGCGQQEAGQPGERLLHRQEDPNDGHPRGVRDQASYSFYQIGFSYLNEG